ncbi:MAG: hypothetical protein KDA92_19465, partial [Planctomycetales bacterium]|nr:hypothetical protein [Planctomycetales bacterium]
AALATGKSLQRLDAASYGNDAAWWQAAIPNPGAYELSGVVPGDFNGDGNVDASDLALFAAGYRAGDMQFDLTNDGVVDTADRDLMVFDLMKTTYGDANFDGVFNSSDLIVVFQAGQYEDGLPVNSMWATGDWDMDGEFSTSDLVTAFQTGAYVAAATTASQAATSVNVAQIASANESRPSATRFADAVDRSWASQDTRRRRVNHSLSQADASQRTVLSQHALTIRRKRTELTAVECDRVFGENELSTRDWVDSL